MDASGRSWLASSFASRMIHLPTAFWRGSLTASNHRLFAGASICIHCCSDGSKREWCFVDQPRPLLCIMGPEVVAGESCNACHEDVRSCFHASKYLGGLEKVVPLGTWVQEAAQRVERG